MISITFIYLWAIFYFFLSAISFYKFFSQHHQPMTEYIYLSTPFFYPSNETHSNGDDGANDEDACSDDALCHAYRDQLSAATELQSSPIQEGQTTQREHGQASLSRTSPAMQVIGLRFAPKFPWRSRAPKSDISSFGTGNRSMYFVIPASMIYFLGNTCLMTRLPRSSM